MTPRGGLDLEENEHGFSAHVGGTVDPRFGVPWLSVLIVAVGLVMGWLVVWPAALPFLGIGLGLFSPWVGARMYGLTVGRGRIDLVGAEILPLHHVDVVQQDGRTVVLVGAGRTVRLALDTTADHVRVLASRLQREIDAQGDADDVPDTLADLQRDAGGGDA